MDRFKRQKVQNSKNFLRFVQLLDGFFLDVPRTVGNISPIASVQSVNYTLGMQDTLGER